MSVDLQADKVAIGADTAAEDIAVRPIDMPQQNLQRNVDVDVATSRHFALRSEGENVGRV